MKKQQVKLLEVFENPCPGRDYEIEMDCPEFTCLCPKTGQPDFAVVEITYVPDRLCVELKSLKLYLWAYRNEGGFHEKVINGILDDLVSVLKPRKMRVVGDFNVRGGIQTSVTGRERTRTRPDSTCISRRTRCFSAPVSGKREAPNCIRSARPSSGIPTAGRRSSRTGPWSNGSAGWTATD